MPFTYEPSASMSSKDIVRLLIGDTDSASRLLWDEEIAAIVARNSSVNQAAAEAARAVAGTYSRLVDKEVGDLKIRYSQRAEQYRDLADTLEARADQSWLADVSPYLGGRSIADKQAALDDTDRTDTAFARGAHDFPGGANARGQSEST